jgi:O-antigen/teichoic acid export membrane protein
MIINFASIAAVSRLLTPGEIGISVIGTGIVLIALGLREFATSDFLIQHQEITRDDIRASFTVVVLLTLLITIGMLMAAPWFGTFYGEEQLARFIRIAAVAGLIEALSLHIRGLLRRQMAFGALAFINTMSMMATAWATILLALAGFSYMSVAWATLAAAATTTALSFYFRPEMAILRPSLRCWRSVLTFGGYNGASFVINQTYQALPQLVLGQVLPASAVGLYNRATTVSDIPDRIVLTSVFSVAFPALAVEVREGRSLQQAYLRALGYITVFYWPALMLLAILAYPTIRLLLGTQWLSVTPLLQVMAVAGLAWFPVLLTSPVLLAVGANRDRVVADLLGRALSAVVLCSSAYFGIMAMAASKLVTLPYQMILSLCYVRRHVPFKWREAGAALWQSAMVTAGAAAGPITVVAMSDFSFELSMPASALALLLAATGWVTAVYLTQHPILAELKKAAEAILETTFVHRVHARIVGPGARTGEAR